MRAVETGKVGQERGCTLFFIQEAVDEIPRNNKK
jgi:hypothetical protein